MSWKYLVPNGFTALSLVLGLASVTQSAAGLYESAAWLILLGVLLDKFDGAAARMLGASSEFGAEMDSFADFVVFGAAPAALAFFSLTGGIVGPGEGFIGGACAVYTLAVAIRLARFNVTEPEGGSLLFLGIPTTLCGGLFAAAWLAANSQGVVSAVEPAIPVILITFGLMMVSNLRIPKFSTRWSKPVNAFLMVNFVIACILIPLRMYPEYLFFLSSLYLVVGTTWATFRGEQALAADAESLTDPGVVESR
jgi:CDP-diacylglycerol--serine O-phosphatidyltransferase